MEAFQEQVLKEFAELPAVSDKLIAVEGICERLIVVAAKLSEQGLQLDQVKVNLSCDALGKVQQEQVYGSNATARAPHQWREGRRRKARGYWKLHQGPPFDSNDRLFRHCIRPNCIQFPDLNMCSARTQQGSAIGC